MRDYREKYIDALNLQLENSKLSAKWALICGAIFFFMIINADIYFSAFWIAGSFILISRDYGRKAKDLEKKIERVDDS
jgi:hypothetical protein